MAAAAFPPPLRAPPADRAASPRPRPGPTLGVVWTSARPARQGIPHGDPPLVLSSLARHRQQPLTVSAPSLFERFPSFSLSQEASARNSTPVESAASAREALRKLSLFRDVCISMCRGRASFPSRQLLGPPTPSPTHTSWRSLTQASGPSPPRLAGECTSPGSCSARWTWESGAAGWNDRWRCPAVRTWRFSACLPSRGRYRGVAAASQGCVIRARDSATSEHVPGANKSCDLWRWRC